MDIQLTRPDQAHLPAFDFSTLSAINTCPTWGLVRYHMKKKFGSESRSLALDAGSACHEFYAALRIFQLGVVQGYPDHAANKGLKLFGKERWEQMSKILDKTKYGEGDWRIDALNFSLKALQTFGFYDDPGDQKRTLSNLETSCIAYFDKWNFANNRIYIADVNDPTSFVGIEIAFDLVVDGKYRFIGKMDGLNVIDGDDLEVQENKTSGRLGNAWRDQFELSHQVTGYCVAASVYANKHVSRARVIGNAIPTPKNGVDSVDYIPCNRDLNAFAIWEQWFFHTIEEIWAKYKDNAPNAPKYTHSCNRYFQTCAFMPLCAAPPEERAKIVKEQMVDQLWSPLD